MVLLHKNKNAAEQASFNDKKIRLRWVTSTAFESDFFNCQLPQLIHF